MLPCQVGMPHASEHDIKRGSQPAGSELPPSRRMQPLTAAMPTRAAEAVLMD